MLPLIVLVVTVTVLLPDMYIPPPCEGEDDFSGFTTLQRGDGLLRSSQRFESWPTTHALPEQGTQQSVLFLWGKLSFVKVSPVGEAYEQLNATEDSRRLDHSG